MTIDEAIKILEEPDWLTTENHAPEYSAAQQLGIEALKIIKIHRQFPPLPDNFRLPGETT